MKKLFVFLISLILFSCSTEAMSRKQIKFSEFDSAAEQEGLSQRDIYRISGAPLVIFLFGMGILVRAMSREKENYRKVKNIFFLTLLIMTILIMVWTYYMFKDPTFLKDLLFVFILIWGGSWILEKIPPIRRLFLKEKI